MESKKIDENEKLFGIKITTIVNINNIMIVVLIILIILRLANIRVIG